MEQLLDKVQPQQRWHALLQNWRAVTVRLRMDEPLTLSRCSSIPLLFLFIQSLVIGLIEVCGVPLGVAGGITQFLVTLVLGGWIAIQLELSDVMLENHTKLELLQPSPAPGEEMMNLDEMESI